MVEGFPRLVNQLIESRTDAIMTSDDYELLMDSIYQDLEEKLSSVLKDLDEETKNNFIEDIKSNIFQQVFHQSKLTYRVAFKDAFTFFIDTLVMPKN
jgi:hypothetical protein